MAENDNGRLNFGIGIDLDGLQRGADEAKGVFDGIASEAQAKGADIDRAFGTDAARGAAALSTATRQSLSEIGSKCSELESEIASLEGEYARLGKEMSAAYESGRDGDLQALQERAVAVKGEMNVRKGLLSELREQADALEQEAAKIEESRTQTDALGESHSSLRQRIRELQEQMAQLREQGIDETSEAYRELTAELGRLRDIQSDIQKQGSVLANDQAQFQGIISGLQGVTGGYSALSGVMGLFGSKNEELNKIMTKAQSLMSITIGLQQVSQMLDKDSAFQLTTVAKVREWWNKLLDVGRGKTAANTAAVELNTAAQKGNAGAVRTAGAAQQMENTIAETGTAANIGLAGAFRMVGAAIKSIPVFGWIATAITAIVTVTTKFISKAKEARKAAEEFNKSVAEMAAEPVAAMMKLYAQWNALGDNMEAKLKFINDNTKAFEDLGLAIKDVNDAEAVFTSTDTLKSYINAQLVRAQADQTYKDATDLIKKENEAMLKLEEAQENLEKAQETPTVIQYGFQGQVSEVANPDIAKYTKEVQKYNEEIDGYSTKIKNALGSFNELNKEADDIIKGINKGLEDSADGVSEVSGETIEALQAELKEQQDAMNKAVIGTEEFANAQKRVNEIQEKLNAAMGKTSGAAAADNDEKEAKAREDAERSAGAALAKITRENQKDQIALMEDGHEKRMAQLDYEYEEQKRKINEQADSFRDLNAKTGAETVKTSSGEDTGLTADQLDALYTARINAREGYEQRVKDLDEKEEEERQKSLDRLLNQTATYQQRSEALENQYEENLKLMLDEEGKLREGVTQRNVDILNEQYVKSQEELWESYIDSMESLSIDALKGLVDEMESLVEAAKAELEELEGSNDDGENDERIAELKKRIADLTKKCTDAQTRYNDKLKDGNSKGAQNTEKLGNAISKMGHEVSEVGDAFSDLGDQIGGAFGEALSDIGETSSKIGSVISSIGKFVEVGIVGIQSMSWAGVSAIKAVENASTILAMIGMVMEIATAIASLFNNDDKKEEEIQALQERIDDLQWELDNAEAARVRDATGGALSTVSAMYQSALSGARSVNREGRSYTSMLEGWAQASKRATAADVAHDRTVRNIIKTYTNLGYTVDKAIGEDKYKAAGEAVSNYAEQLALTYEQYEKEQSKKKTDTDKLKEYEQTMDEIAQSMVDTLNSAVEDIIGGSYEDISKQLGDAFVEAFQAGEDAAEAWGDTVEDIVNDIVKEMLIQQWIEPKVADIFDEYMKRWFTDGEYNGNDAVVESMGDFSAELNAAMDDFSVAWQEVSDAMGWAADSTREAASQGIASASQESIDELNGRMTAIQGHTYSINENTEVIAAATNLILQSVMGIEDNTGLILDAIRGTEDGIGALAGTVDDLVVKGIRIR